MELKGENVAIYRKQNNRDWCDTKAIATLLQMLLAIENVHNCGIIHRDVKPVSKFTLF
jgi:serine/threonine protein kinase